MSTAEPVEYLLATDDLRGLLQLFTQLEQERLYLADMIARDGEHGIPTSAIVASRDEHARLQQELKAQLARRGITPLAQACLTYPASRPLASSRERATLERLNNWLRRDASPHTPA